MTKPLLPAIEAAGQVREVAFALLLRDRRPIETSEGALLGGADWAGCATAARRLS